MQTFICGPQGMVPALNGAGDWIKLGVHQQEMAEWERINDKNRQLAENILKQQDSEIAAKNVTIQQLQDHIKELTA